LVEAETITGGVVSTTVTVAEQLVELVALSVTVTPIVFVPSGSSLVNVTIPPLGGPPAGIEFVCTATPLTVQVTLSASPSSSDTTAVNVVAVPHSTWLLAGHNSEGGVFGGATAINCARISPPGLVAV
jgi:hypothetical protein